MGVVVLEYAPSGEQGVMNPLLVAQVGHRDSAQHVGLHGGLSVALAPVHVRPGRKLAPFPNTGPHRPVTPAALITWVGA